MDLKKILEKAFNAGYDTSVMYNCGDGNAYKDFESFYRNEIKQLTLNDVSQRSELLKLEDKEIPFDTWLDKYFKPSPTTELIYRQKNNNREFTERELIRMYKQAYQL